MQTRALSLSSPYPLIDALRALAAITVVWYHVIEVGQWSTFPHTGPALIMRIGWIGVDCFFVISGFVITLSALKDQQRQPDGYWKAFAMRRLARIVPLYALTCVMYVLLVRPQLLQAPLLEQVRQWLSHALFVHNLHASTAHTINGPNWSIGLEMQFYLLVMLLAPWLARTASWRMVIVLVVVAWGYRYGVTFVQKPGEAGPYLQSLYTVQLPGTLDQFALGMALGMAVARGGRLMAWLQPGWRPFLAWASGCVVLGVAAWQIFWSHPEYWNTLGMIVFWRTLLGAVFACALAAAMSFPLASAMVLRPLCYLGKISYGIYLWHMLVLLTLLELPELRGAPLLVKVLAGTVLLASISWHFFERPVLERVRQRSRGATPA